MNAMKGMPGIIVALLLVFMPGVEAAAQYAQLSRKGTALYSGGTELSPARMQELFRSVGSFSYEDWRNASRGFNAGKGLLISFGALTGAGILTTGIGAVGLMVEGVAVGIGTVFFAPLAAVSGGQVDIGYRSKFAGVATAGVCMVGAGMLCMITGTAVYCIYKKRLDTMTAECNAFRETSLAFGPARNGLGLTLSF